MSPPSTVTGSSTRPTTGTPARSSTGRVASGSRRRPSFPGWSSTAPVPPHECRVVRVDRVRVAGIVLGDDDLGPGILEEAAERLVLGLRLGDLRRRTPAVRLPRGGVLRKGPPHEHAPELAPHRCAAVAVHGRATYPTAFAGLRPSSSTARSASTHSIPIAIRVSRVALPRCGVSTTFSSESSPSSTSGSCSKTSSAAPAIVPRSERVDECPLVDDRAARRVDEHRRRLHRRETLGVDQMARLLGQRDVEGDDVGLGEQAVEVVVPPGEHGPGTEGLGEARRLAPDPAGPDDEDVLPVEARPEHELERELPLVPPADEAVALGYPPEEREHQPECELGRRAREDVRRVGDHDPASPGLGEVDVVHPDRIVGDHAELRTCPVEVVPVHADGEHRHDSLRSARLGDEVEVTAERGLHLGGDGCRHVDAGPRHRSGYSDSTRGRWPAEYTSLRRIRPFSNGKTSIPSHSSLRPSGCVAVAVHSLTTRPSRA